MPLLRLMNIYKLGITFIIAMIKCTRLMPDRIGFNFIITFFFLIFISFFLLFLHFARILKGHCVSLSPWCCAPSFSSSSFFSSVTIASKRWLAQIFFQIAASICLDGSSTDVEQPSRVIGSKRARNRANLRGNGPRRLPGLVVTLRLSDYKPSTNIHIYYYRHKNCWRNCGLCKTRCWALNAERFAYLSLWNLFFFFYEY